MKGATKGRTTIFMDGLQEHIRMESQRNAIRDLMALAVWLDIAAQRVDRPVDLIQRWRFCAATDPRDKVYALMGMCSRGSMPRTESCNYDMSVVDVFCSLTIDLMQSDKSLVPLIMDPRFEAEKATPGIPRLALDASHLSSYKLMPTGFICMLTNLSGPWT